MSQAESDGVDKCVDYMTTHLCHRESSSDNIQQETVQLDVSPPEAQPEEFLQIQTEQPYEDIQPNPPFSCIEHSPHSDTSLQYTNSPQVSEQDRKKEWMLRHGVDPISLSRFSQQELIWFPLHIHLFFMLKNLLQLLFLLVIMRLTIWIQNHLHVLWGMH